MFPISFSGVHVVAFVSTGKSILIGSFLVALLPLEASIAAQSADDAPASESFAAVRTYSIALLGRYRDTGVPRWESPLCVVQYGLDPAGQKRFVDRLAQVGKPLHVAVDRGKCQPNVTIVYSSSPAADAADIATRKADYIRDHRPDGIDRFRAATDAIDWIALALPTTAEGYRVVEAGSGRLPNSHIERPTRSVAVETFIIVDAAKARSMAPAQLFDCLTMITLSSPRIGGIPDNSVLQLANEPPAKAPPEMTPEDRAYLTALGSIAKQPDLSHQREAIETRMAGILG
jgi:hypothetical protein